MKLDKVKPEDDCREVRDWAVPRLNHFLEKLKAENNGDDIEAVLYTMMITARTAFHKAYRANQ